MNPEKLSLLKQFPGPSFRYDHTSWFPQPRSTVSWQLSLLYAAGLPRHGLEPATFRLVVKCGINEPFLYIPDPELNSINFSSCTILKLISVFFYANLTLSLWCFNEWTHLHSAMSHKITEWSADPLARTFLQKQKLVAQIRHHEILIKTLLNYYFKKWYC